MTNKQPVESPYKQFFMAMWEEYCEGNLDIAELVYDAAVKFGLAKEEKYDPTIHPENLASEWGLEEGDSCYVLVKQPESPKRESIERDDKLARFSRWILSLPNTNGALASIKRDARIHAKMAATEIEGDK